LNEEQTLKDLHRLLLETQVIEGKLVCGNCGHQYVIKEGIANFLLPSHLGTYLLFFSRTKVLFEGDMDILEMCETDSIFYTQFEEIQVLDYANVFCF
jgi:uncharacterized protein YbaR (Trm112 family)